MNDLSDSGLIVRAPQKFVDPRRTATGEPRASVSCERIETLWLNTGTLCNVTCENCYIESSPRNDRLSYLGRREVAAYLEEIRREALGVREIGITGGEPFMNPQILEILEDCLATGVSVLVLTNAMRPMMKVSDGLRVLQQRYPATLRLRVSLDHFQQHHHEQERGPRSWQPAIAGLRWLAQQGFQLSVAGRTRWGDSEETLRAGFAGLFASLGLGLDAQDPEHLVLFPEMDPAAEVPEITTACWDILGVSPDAMMCASSRMVVKRKNAAQPEVLSCTLLPYEPAFSLGTTLVESLGSVALNHPYCARFCVLGGGSCSG